MHRHRIEGAFSYYLFLKIQQAAAYMSQFASVSFQRVLRGISFNIDVLLTGFGGFRTNDSRT